MAGVDPETKLGAAVPSGRPYPPRAHSEPHRPAQASVLVAIGLQLLLPERVTAGPTWLLPVGEAVLLIGLTLASPRRLEGEHQGRRRLALALTALVSLRASPRW